MAELVIRRGLEEPDTSDNFTPHKPARPDKAEGGKRLKAIGEQIETLEARWLELSTQLDGIAESVG